MRSRDKQRPGSRAASAGGRPGSRAASAGGRPGSRAASAGGRPGSRAPAPAGDAAHISGLYARIYDLVRRIPAGRVATYGQVAELADMPGAARVVGTAMRAARPELGLPWQRVVGKRARGIGQVSIHDPVGAAMQRALLEAEGVVFSASAGISLDQYGWLTAPGVPDPRRKPRAVKTSTPARPGPANHEGAGPARGDGGGTRKPGRTRRRRDKVRGL